MTTTPAALFAGSYPAVLIQRWTGANGWPCFRLFVALPGHLVPIHGEFATIEEARAEAVAAADSWQEPCAIIDQTEDEGE